MNETVAGDVEGGIGNHPSRQILVLHGGGYRGLYTASVLEQLEKELERPIIDSFDMVAGTSIGGIIALALADGMPAADIRKKIQDDGPALFPAYGVVGRTAKFVRRMFTPPHDRSKLKALITSVLSEDKRLQDLGAAVLIPSCDAIGSASGPDAVVFSNHEHDRLKETRLIDVALATSAAPTYFASHQMPASSSQLVDGGVIANSPSWIALTKAIADFGWHLDYLRMLIIGTTTAPAGRVPETRKAVRWGSNTYVYGGSEGILYWLRKGRLLGLLMNGQQRLADEMCRQALEPEYCLEINSFRSEEQNQVAASLDQASGDATTTLLHLANEAVSEARETPDVMQLLRRKAVRNR